MALCKTPHGGIVMAKTDKGNNFLKTVKNIISATNKKEKAALAADTVLKRL